jgi:transposase
MMTEKTRREQSTAARTLYVAFELSAQKWRLALTTDCGETARHYTVEAGDLVAVLERLAKARQVWRLAAATPVVSCYEAGRDGFWLHRCLTAHGLRNVVVDASSIEQDRRAKHVKTDRVDAERLLGVLVGWAEGRKCVRVVHVPSEAEEDARHADRELSTVKGARAAVMHRVTGLLVTQGLRVRLRGRHPLNVAALRAWDGAPLGPGLRGRVEREVKEFEALTARIATLEGARRQAMAAPTTPAAQQMAQLAQLKGLGANGAARFVTEFFAWRAFRNGREVGALAGLTPTPHQSGAMSRDQGISKAGNGRVRTMAIEIAWCWLRFQPRSALAEWYQARFGSGSRRMRRIGIVALARKLLIALWRYLETGALPDGAVLNAEA